MPRIRKGKMGDIDGSSRAAQSAQSDETNQKKRTGFFGRLFSTKTLAEDEFSPAPQSQSIAPKLGLANLRSLRVEDVAIPKAEIIAVPDTMSKAELVDIFRSSTMTRLPVFSGTLDSPVGMVHLKDFALSHGFETEDHDFSLTQTLRPVLFVPPSMPLSVLLTKMQTERSHMALVIDEYGGVDGLVTIEDLLEQVVGEIEDEHDIEEADSWSEEKSGQYLLLAKTPLVDFAEETGIDLVSHDDVDAEEVDTIGGLVFMLAGRVPVRGEVVSHPTGAEFEIVDADPRRVKRIRLRLASVVKAAE